MQSVILFLTIKKYKHISSLQTTTAIDEHTSLNIIHLWG